MSQINLVKKNHQEEKKQELVDQITERMEVESLQPKLNEMRILIGVKVKTIVEFKVKQFKLTEKNSNWITFEDILSYRIYLYRLHYNHAREWYKEELSELVHTIFDIITKIQYLRMKNDQNLTEKEIQEKYSSKLSKTYYLQLKTQKYYILKRYEELTRVINSR